MSVTVVALFASVALVAANAFFVASEFALVKMRATRLEQLASHGHRRARLALGLSRKLDAYLSACQLGITLASLGLGWLGEPAFAAIFARCFGLSGGHEHVAAIVAGLVTITFLHTVLGELAPKSLAIRNTEAVTLWTAVPLRVFYLVAFPFIWTLNQAAALSLRLLGLRPATESEHVQSPEELRLIMHRAALEPGARRLIDRVFDYTVRVARDVMTPRRQVVFLDATAPIEDNVRRVLEQEFSRYPVVEPDTGAVLGYMHIKDLMAALVDETRPDIRQLVREPVYATESVSLDQLRREFQRRRVHIAVIRDRRGAWKGIVTFEDLLEEVVGDIQDEQDLDEQRTCEPV
jgi:CBS domain containing-hemolysin-like protein